jgi:hypothetical protein
MAGLAVAGASRADAQVSFQGVFPLPNGSVSLSIGDPTFGVGTYVPYGYPVAVQPGYGYGFMYHRHWVPARPYGSRWIVVDQPYYGVYAAPVYGPHGYARAAYTHGYHNDYGHGGDRYDRHDNHGWNHGNHGENHGKQGHGNRGHDRH